MRIICTVVLVFEVLVLGLAIPVAINLEGIDAVTAGSLWGGLAAAALVLAGLQKYAWAHYAGWALQVVFLFSSFWVSGMPLVAGGFASLWVTGVIMGRRVDETRAAHEEAARVEEAEAVPSTGPSQTR